MTGMTDSIEVLRPPDDSGAFITPSRFLSVKHKERNPSWRSTVSLSRKALAAIREGDHTLLWPTLLIWK